jgi:P-type Ca2+ transporter type 2C
MNTKNKHLVGISQSEVNKMREKHGSNALPPPPAKHWFKILFEIAQDKTIIILGIAAFISIGIALYLNEAVYEGSGIVIAILIAVAVGFASEFRSNRSFHKLLEESEKIRAKIIRDGKFHTISSDDIVVNDIVLLETGDKIPADGEVVHFIELSCDTSMITGETNSFYPQNEEKVYRGYTILSGEGAMKVTSVGIKTEMGKIQEALATDPEPTPLQERLSELADKIGMGGFIAAVIIFIGLLIRNYFFGSVSFASPKFYKTILDAFIVSVTIVVVAVPEGLPLAVTLSLALNMRRMAKDKNLVRTLAASETLGAATVICSDKTGTLTLNKMRIRAFWTPDTGIVDGDKLPDEIVETEIFKNLLSINSTAHLEETNGVLDYVGNPTEGSMLLYLNSKDINYLEIRESSEVITRLPFSSSRKMMSTFIELDDLPVVIVKGAPEKIVERSITCGTTISGEKFAIDSRIDEINKVIKECALNGERVLALAYKSVDKDVKIIEETNLNLWGFAIIRDPVREEVYKAINECRTAGIEVKMVTGDNPLTAQSISKELGLIQEGDIILEGDEFEKMDDDAIKEILPKLRILARSRPQDKFRLVSLLKEVGEVVAVTGDGTNDAPAMKKADVGVAMGVAGTEVAKEASDIILLDDNFKSIVKGVLWGRSLNANIRKFLQFQLTVNVAALSIAFVGSLIGGRSPLTAVQLLWVNLIMDTLAAVGLGLEPPDENLLNQKPPKRDFALITKSMWYMIIGMGLYTFIALMFLYHWNFLGEGPPQQREHLSVIFTTFVFIQVFNEINARSIDGIKNPFSGLLQSRGFLSILVLIIIIQILLTQFGGRLFQTYPLSLLTWVKIIGFSLTSLLAGSFIRFIIKTKNVNTIE